MKAKDEPRYNKAVKEEHKNVTSCNVVKSVPKDEVPDDTTIVGSAQATKEKPTGAHRSRLNNRVNEQIDGAHYDSKSIPSLVVNEINVRVFLILF